MSDIYVARQPIFSKNMEIFGYELLYRKTQNNRYEGTDDDRATASLLDDFFFIEFDELTEGKFGFVNFSRNLILEEVPLLLPKEKLVVEILERVVVTHEVVEICKKLKAMGYTLAIDDFVFENQNIYYKELIEIVDIIKVEYSVKNLAEQINLISKYRKKVTFLAERVETMDDYRIAQNLGYSLFQGYFFSKPVMINAKTIGSLSGNMIAILNELSLPEPDFDVITEKFRMDIELSYKLLKLVNSVYYGIRYSINSIHHALIQIGPNELIKWINVMIMKDIQNVENKELIKLSLIRGKMLSLLSQKSNKKGSESDYFLVGIFSSLDALLHQSMEKIVSGLPLKEAVRNALVGEKNALRKALEAIIDFEEFNCDEVDIFLSEIDVQKLDFMQLYVDALKWTKQIA